MARITDENIRDKLEGINGILGEKYRLDHPRDKRDRRTYEQQFAQRIKTAMKDLDPLIQEAVSTLHIVHGPCHPHDLTAEQRVKILLIKQLIGESNRMFSNVLDMLSGMDVSYKSVERLYSDQEVILAVHNLHVLILRKKDVNASDATGDGTGYSLTVKKNYESCAQKLKDLAKENPKDDEKDGIKKLKGHRKHMFA